MWNTSWSVTSSGAVRELAAKKRVTDWRKVVENA